jgi:hypothetical protein
MLKNITLSAESFEIELAREKAKREGTTLNDNFRKWLREYARPQADPAAFQASVKEMRKATSGSLQRKFTRDEMNERR